jgi:hypothetical protein
MDWQILIKVGCDLEPSSLIFLATLAIISVLP